MIKFWKIKGKKNVDVVLISESSIFKGKIKYEEINHFTKLIENQNTPENLFEIPFSYIKRIENQEDETQSLALLEEVIQELRRNAAGVNPHRGRRVEDSIVEIPGQKSTEQIAAQRSFWASIYSNILLNTADAHLNILSMLYKIISFSKAILKMYDVLYVC